MRMPVLVEGYVELTSQTNRNFGFLLKGCLLSIHYILH